MLERMEATNAAKYKVFQNKVIKIFLPKPWFMQDEQILVELELLQIKDFTFKTFVRNFQLYF